jgi:hypothetical protein
MVYGMPACSQLALYSAHDDLLGWARASANAAGNPYSPRSTAHTTTPLGGLVRLANTAENPCSSRSTAHTIAPLGGRVRLLICLPQRATRLESAHPAHGCSCSCGCGCNRSRPHCSTSADQTLSVRWIVRCSTLPRPGTNRSTSTSCLMSVLLAAGSWQLVHTGKSAPQKTDVLPKQ